jgi:hypothetical protein
MTNIEILQQLIGFNVNAQGFYVSCSWLLFVPVMFIFLTIRSKFKKKKAK